MRYESFGLHGKTVGMRRESVVRYLNACGHIWEGGDCSRGKGREWISLVPNLGDSFVKKFNLRSMLLAKLAVIMGTESMGFLAMNCMHWIKTLHYRMSWIILCIDNFCIFFFFFFSLQCREHSKHTEPTLGKIRWLVVHHYAVPTRVPKALQKKKLAHPPLIPIISSWSIKLARVSHLQ